MNSYETIALAAGGDEAARQALITDNSPLVWSIVKRFSGRGHEAEDLFQTGCMGLLKAIDRFDSSYGLQFSTYAVPMITGEIKRLLRDDGIIKVGRRLKEIWIKAYAVRAKYISEHDEEPSTAELARLVGVSEEEIVMAVDASRPPDSIERELGDGNHHTVGDLIEGECNTENETVNRLSLSAAMKDFTEREQQIIGLRYYDDKTQSQVAQIIGISQVQVSRIEKKLLLRMREKLSVD